MARSGKTITFATDLVPQEDNVYNLGDSSQRWKINGITPGNARVFYGTCDTAAGTVLKEVICAQYDKVLTIGDMIIVKFSITNTGAVGSLQLTIKNSTTDTAGTTAKNIKRQYNGTGANNLVSTAELNKDSISIFIYNGTYWILTNADYNNTYSYMRPYESTAKGSYSSINLNPAKTAAAGWRFQLSAGKYFMYSHYYDNQAQSALTLNIGSTGAKPIYINGAASSSSNYTLPGGQYLVYYDGTNYYFRTDDKMTGNITGKATTSGTADKIKDLTTTDKASSSNDWRRVWISYANKVEGRPAYTDDLVFQTSTNTLKTTKFQGALIGNADTATSANRLSQTAITSLSSFTHTTDLIYAAAGGSNSVTDKPSEVDAFGVLSYKTASGWYGQILTASNTGSGIYWRTGTTLSGGWKKLLDSSNYTDYAVAKTAGVTAVTWDATNKKLTRTINGTDADVMTAAQMSTALGLGTIASKAENNYMKFGGDDTNLGSGSPAATAKTYWADTTKVSDNMITGYYNHSGTEYSLLFSKRSNYGSILKWGYGDRYLRILRVQGGTWKSTDWEKIDAGYADSAGNITGTLALANLTKGDANTALMGKGSSTAPAYVSVSPSISITAGTADNAPKVNLTVLGVSGTTAQEITKATTGVYGATKLYNGVDSTSTTLAATANAVKTAYDKAAGIVAAADAMVFKGTRDGAATSSNGGAGGLTPAANRGDTYKVAIAGYINGEPVEVGDIIICTTDSTAASTSSNYSTIKANWVIIQNNVDGAVFYSTNTLSNGQYLVADGANGKVKSQNLPTASTTTAGITTVGASGGAAAYSHGTHVSYGTSTAKIGTASAGSASTVSRSDHVHAIDLATGDNNGQVKIAGTNVTVKGLGNRAFDSTEYLPLSGGVMTGNIRRYYSSASTEPMITALANNLDIYLWQVGHGGAAATNLGNNGYKLLYKGTNDSTNNYLQLIATKSDGTEIIAAQWDELGNASYNGKATFNLGSSATTSSDRKFIIQGASSNKLSLGSTGIQAYNNSNTASIMYLQYYGGTLEIGSTSTATAARNFYGTFDFKSANGFTYSGMAAGTDNADRVIWFSYNGIIGRPVYDNDFKYNPSTNTLTIGTGTLTAINYSGNAATASKLTAITTTDAASSSATWRRLWISYSNNTEGRPAYTDSLVYQTSTNTLKTPHLLVEHASGGQQEIHITYSDTIDYWWGVGTANENHGLYDVKANKWILSAGAANTWTFVGNVTGTATTASKLSNTALIGNTDRPVYFTANGVPAQTTYRMAGTNVGATTGLTYSNDLDTGIWYVNGISGTDKTALYNQADGVIIANKYSTSWISEIFQDYRTGQLAIRGKNNGTWAAWRNVLDSTNYTTYTVTKTGTGASGSWGISVTGSSASCTGNAATASKISAKLATTTKTYLLGTATAITATAANVDITGDTGVYLTATAGELSAARHSWNASGTEKAYTIYNTTDDSIDFVFI